MMVKKNNPSDTEQRYNKFCRLVGGSHEAEELKLKFATHLGAPKYMDIFSPKQYLEENLRPKESYIKESWLNPKLI